MLQVYYWILIDYFNSSISNIIVIIVESGGIIYLRPDSGIAQL